MGWSIRLRLGIGSAQLTALRRLRLSRDGVQSFAGRGEEEIIRCAKRGLGASSRDALVVAPIEKRSHRSKAGSACGVFRASASFLTLTAGVIGFELDGEEEGEELRARF